MIGMLGASLQAQAVFFEWTRSYDGGGTDRGLHVMTDAFSNSYLTGVAALPGGDRIISSAYTEDGTLLWQRTGNTTLPGTVKQVERDDALNTFVLCQTGPSAFTVIRYNSNAKEKWRQNYAYFIVKIKVGNPAAVYTCGITNLGVTMNRLNKNTGATTWTRSYADTELSTSLCDFTIDGNSNLYFGGTTDGGATSDDYRLVKLTKNGNLVYNIQYDGGGGDDETYKITANNAGELYLVGDYDNDILPRTFYHLVKFNAAGVHQWHTFFEENSANVYFPMEVQIGPDGNAVVVGTDRDFFNINLGGETSRIEVTKFNGVTGALLYSVFPADVDLTNEDILEQAKCMTIDATNNIYIGGSSNVYAGIGTDPDRWIALKVIGATGAREWVEAGVLNDPANEIVSIAVTATNESYLAGTENLSGNPDIQLTKYCEVGCLGARMASKENTSGISVYPNPSNSLFVLTNDAGTSFTISVYDIAGMLIEEQTSSASELTFGQNLPPGVYIVKYTQEKEIKTFRIVKT